MALGLYFSPTGFTTSAYNETIKKLDAAGAGNPKGRLFHFAMESDGAVQVFDVWESEESFQAFGETLMPIMTEVGANPGEPMIAPIVNTIVGK